MKELQYPIGKFIYPDKVTDEMVTEWIAAMESLPERLIALVKNLSEEQLETPYRPEGWTVRQVVHHIADSHHNSYTRFKWALTENAPLIKVYKEKEWSALVDARTAPIALSLPYITTLHAKLIYMIKRLSKEDMEKYYIHPEGNVAVSIKENIAKYAWHGNHHYAHIAKLIQRKGWS